MTPFVAATGTVTVGAAQPRLLEDVGFAPRALLLWWSGQASDGAAAGNRGGIGVVAGGEQAAIAWASEDAAALARTATWAGSTALVGLDTPDDRAPALLGEAVLLPGGFELRLADVASSWRLHYLALGGADIRARVGWVAPAATRLPIGFGADVVLFATAAVAERDAVLPGLSVGVGVAAGPGAQAATALASRGGAPPGSVGGAQRGDVALLAVGDDRTISLIGAVSSVDEDGLWLRWPLLPATPHWTAYLALGGVRCRVGAAASPLTPGRRRTWTRLRPEALVAFSWGLGAAACATDIARLSLGAATSREAAGATSWDDRDTSEQVTATHVRSSSRELVLVPDTQTGGLHAAARLAAFHRRGFTLDWSTSDGLARQLFYLALARRRAPRHARLARLLRRQRQRSTSSSGEKPSSVRAFSMSQIRQRFAETPK